MDESYYHQIIIDIASAVSAELGARATVELDECSKQAISAAIYKAACRGFLRGATEHKALVNDQWQGQLPVIREQMRPGVAVPDAPFVGGEIDLGEERDLWIEAGFGGDPEAE